MSFKIHTSTFLDDQKKHVIRIEKSVVPQLSLDQKYKNPFRRQLTEEKIQWEREFIQGRMQGEAKWSKKWLSVMNGDALVSYRMVEKMKEELYSKYLGYPFDLRALLIRDKIEELRKNYPIGMELYFKGDWDRMNEIQDELASLEERINNLDSQKHLDDLWTLKDQYEQEQFGQGILIGRKKVPRTILLPEHLPADLKENPEKYQRKDLLTLEKLPLQTKKRKRETGEKDPHQEYFEHVLKRSKEEELIGVSDFWNQDLEDLFQKGNWNIIPFSFIKLQLICPEKQ